MKKEGLLRMLVALLVFGASVFISCTSTIESEPAEAKTASAVGDTSEDTGGPPPLVVDMNTPLLLDEPTEEEVAVAKTKASVENTACFVCHANYRSEFLAGYHAGVNIDCVHCHGESTAHRNDENNTTPPEIMYPAEKIDSFCQGCHSTTHDISPKKIIIHWFEHLKEEANPSCSGCHKEDDVPPAKVVARWKERGLDKAQTDPDEIVCTDCHGDHRMRIRTVIWDKKSGKLLQTNRKDL